MMDDPDTRTRLQSSQPELSRALSSASPVEISRLHLTTELRGDT